jgi:hypothetical protein
VTLNDDHVATEAPANMARSVDILVVVPTGAQHAATAALNAVRPASMTTIEGNSRGSSGILRCLASHS